MPWSGGVYTRAYPSWTNDATNNLPISAAKFDAEDNDFAAGLNNCMTVDGLNKPNANITPLADNTYSLGTGSVSWANIYLGSNHAPAFDSISGNIGYYARTQAEINAGVVPTNFWVPHHIACGYVLPERYGGAGDNSTINNTAFSNAILVAGQVDGRVGITMGPAGVWKFTAGISLTGTGQTLGGIGPPVGGSGVTGARLIGIGGTPVLSFSGLGASTDCITVGGSNLPQVELRNFILQCNGSSGSPNGRDGIANNGSNLSIYENLTVWNSQRHSYSMIVSGTNWIEKLTMRQCRVRFAGFHALFLSLAGAGGAYINEVIYDQFEVRGVSYITAGANAVRMTSTASGGGSKFSNHFFAKSNFDCIYNTGNPTPDVNVINIDSGSAQTFSCICGGWENTGSAGSPGSGRPIKVSGSGSFSGLFVAGMITNSLWGAGAFDSAITNATVFDYSFGTTLMMGPATIASTSSGVSPVLALSGQTTSSSQADISISRTGAANQTVGQNANIQFGNSTSNTFAILQEYNGAVIVFTFASGSWGERARILPGPGAGIQIAGASSIYSGTGVISNSVGSNGDYYFRQDTPGTANQRLYVKSAGAWVGIV